MSHVADDLVRLVDAAVVVVDRQVGDAGLLEKAPRLGSGRLEVAPVAGELLELRVGRGQRMTGEHHAAHRLHDRDAGQVLRAAPPVHREGEGAAHPRVVIRLARVVRGEQEHAVPVALLHRDLVAERLDEVVARLWREAAELDRRPVAANGLDAHRHVLGDDGPEAVEVGLPLVVVALVLHSVHECTGLMLDELERAGAVHVVLVPVVTMRLQILLAVDPVERGRERGQEGAGRELQIEHDGGVVGRLDRFDHVEERLPRARHALGREDDPVVAGLDVRRGHRRSVVERHAFLDLERVRLAAVGRLRHVPDAQVAHEVGGLGILRVHPDQQAVERCVGMDESIGLLPVSVLRRRLAGHHEVQRATCLRRFRECALGAEAEPYRAAEKQRGGGSGPCAPIVTFHRWFLLMG